MPTVAETEPSAAPVEAIRVSAFHTGMTASRHLDYIYVQNWKCGSSTIRSTLWAAEHSLGLASQPGDPHEPSPHSPFIADPRKWERVDENFVFTIARNPYVRVLSAYLDKVVNRDRRVWEPFAARHGLFDETLSFLDFLKIVAGTSEGQMDPHWRPQTFNLAPSIIPYDFIGSLENFEDDFTQILHRIFPDRATPIRDYKRHQTDAASKLAQFYGPEEVRLVQAIYHQDFMQLGYDMDPAYPSRRVPTRRPSAATIKSWGRAWRLLGEERFAEAEIGFVALRPRIVGATLEEQLLRCRCEMSGTSRAVLEQSVHAVEQQIVAGYDEWSAWKWYGQGLIRLGRREDGLRALLSALDRHRASGAQRRRRRQVLWRLALVLASKGRLADALATSMSAPSQPKPPRLRAARDVLRSAVLGGVAGIAIVVGAPRWHPDRALGLPGRGRPIPDRSRASSVTAAG